MRDVWLLDEVVGMVMLNFLAIICANGDVLLLLVEVDGVLSLSTLAMVHVMVCDKAIPLLILLMELLVLLFSRDDNRDKREAPSVSPGL